MKTARRLAMVVCVAVLAVALTGCTTRHIVAAAVALFTLRALGMFEGGAS